MVSAVEFKGSAAGACILGIIVSKLSRHGQESSPIILLPIDKGSKVCFHCAVLSLGLSICLWMERSGEPLLDAEKIA